MVRKFALCSALLVSTFAIAQSPIEEKTKGLEGVEGLFKTYRDPKGNRVLLEVSKSQFREFLFVTAVRTGLGSNDVGIDRGQLGPTEVFRVRRMADKVLFEVPNLAFRASGTNANEQRAVRESFAPSVLWAGQVMAENEDGTVLVDVSSLILSDANDVVGTLRGTNQGSASIDAGKSAIDFENLKSFPKNIEFQALLTFKVSSPGAFVRSTAPIAESWSLVQHMSIIELPDDGYRARAFDPRVGAFGISYADYAAPLDQPIVKRFASRHRLQKQPGTNKPIEPIVYYVDNGAPEPVRSALVEGASWWADAFNAAGFEGAFRVEVLPEGADPLDVRYNVIQWVHRSTRGWSYGSSITDPRTGEIIKGHVSLGSLRIRQDRLIFEGLLGTAKTGSGDKDDPIQLSLQRIRQLSAHEVGHTLGLAHNFAGSSYDRGSVMDYPAPRVHERGARLDVSDVYGKGIGEYDKFAITWLYSEFTKGTDERVALDKIVRQGQAKGLLFLSDGDARSFGGSDPRASLWDDGDNPVDELLEVIRVRNLAVGQFGPDRLPAGEPLSGIQEVFVPIFLFHRYQAEATAKAVGGIEYEHAVQDGRTINSRRVSGDEQRTSLGALLLCLEPRFLSVPEQIARLIPPRTFGAGGNVEVFDTRTSPNFDPLAASEAAADIVLSALFDPSRLERVAQQGLLDPKQLSLQEMLDAMTKFVLARHMDKENVAIGSMLCNLYVGYLMRTDSDPQNSLEVRGEAGAQLTKIKELLNVTKSVDALILAEIARYQSRPAGSVYQFVRPAPTPPGSPIGWSDCSYGG